MSMDGALSQGMCQVTRVGRMITFCTVLFANSNISKHGEPAWFSPLSGFSSEFTLS